MLTKNIQGVPKKTQFCVWWAIEGIRSGLETKVGWVLKTSGNFLSDEHKNFPFLTKNDWEKWGQRCLPPLEKWHDYGSPPRCSSFAHISMKRFFDHLILTILFSLNTMVVIKSLYLMCFYIGICKPVVIWASLQKRVTWLWIKAKSELFDN